MTLLDAQFRDRLSALELVLRRALPSTLRGDRRAPQRKGISLEYADFRHYVPGDDVRHLDWASYARLDQLIMKLYHDEEDLRIHLLVDDSRSMAHGTPPKTTFALQLAAALAWIGLHHQSRVAVARLSDTADLLPLSRGGAAWPRIATHLEAATTEGRTPLHQTCADFVRQARPTGSIVLISDLFDPTGLQATLRVLQTATTEVTVIHLLAPDDLEPSLEGDLRLLDSETEHRVEVSLTPSLLDSYQRTARRFIATCAEAAHRRGAAYVHATSASNLEDFLLRVLVREGVLR